MNFQKRVVVHFLVNKLRTRIKADYSQPSEGGDSNDGDILRLIKTWKGLSDEECFNISLESEPRESAATRYSKNDQAVSFLLIFFFFFSPLCSTLTYPQCCSPKIIIPLCSPRLQRKIQGIS